MYIVKSSIAILWHIHVNINLSNWIVQPGDVPATLTLARYLRDFLELTGTKVSCNQSGCGACTVTAEIPDPTDSNNIRVKSVNSVSTSAYKFSLFLHLNTVIVST